MAPQERAQKSAAAMWASDAASQWVGMELTQVDEGHAVVQLTLQSHHCNGHGMGHGGITFMLADTAFAFACNSRNQSTVAQNNTITYTRAAQLGDTLTASAHEVSLTGRSGVYDVSVTNQTGAQIALFRGLSRAIKGQLFTE
jgi:acyl-CoA thioesterase